jgi:adenylate cyclase
MSVIGSSDLIGRAPGGRRLMAVVYADMVGYSRLIGLDDLGTLERLRILRGTLIDPAIDEHGGRLVQTGGDSLLIAFDSIDGAVRCAVDVQQRMPEYDDDQPADRAIRFRVGINIGDVIADGTDLHGDGVNVAARLQAECPPGGICVSRAVRDHVHGRLDLVFSECGLLSLKNIDRPVEAFLLRLEPGVTEPRRPSSAPLPNPSARAAKPPRLSVIVAPLRNFGVPKEHEYLVESITEDISTDLPRYLGPFVVVSDPLRRDGDLASPRDIARELGMGYVIQGSIRGIVDQVALNLQLMDVETGVHLWSERFDFDLGGAMDTRNEVTSGVTSTLFHKLIKDVSRRIDALPPEEWTPDDLVMRGIALSFLPVTAQTNPDPNRHEALGCFEKALAMAPDSVSAKIGVASVLTVNVAAGQSPPGGPDEVRVEQLLADVLRVDGQIAIAHTLMGLLRRQQGRLDDSLAELRVATELAPNDAWAIAHLGITLTFLGQPGAAVALLEKSLRLSAHQSLAPISYGQLGLCHLLLGDTEEAIASLRTARAINPGMYFIHWWLAAALGLKGELDEACAALGQAIKMKPNLVSQVTRSLMPASPRFITLYEKTVYVGLRRAGLCDIWAETNERPVGWIGIPHTDRES